MAYSTHFTYFRSLKTFGKRYKIHYKMKDSGAHSYENREERSELKILAWVNASTPSSSRGVCARDQIILFCATQKWLGNCDSDLVLRLQGATQPSKNRLQMCLNFDYGCCRDLRHWGNEARLLRRFSKWQRPMNSEIFWRQSSNGLVTLWCFKTRLAVNILCIPIKDGIKVL